MRGEDELALVFAELRRREPIFHRPELGYQRSDFETMTAEDYWEVGASGKIYQREFVLEELVRRYADGPPAELLEATDFRCRKLGENTYLLTYHLLQEGGRRTRRATIWERVQRTWRIVYHQGTIIA